jgi:catechol 2,3-dioxygenase-like lactoylglutathione lyase family enzyme
MLGAASVIAFVPSLDLTRSGVFYADVLGLAMEEVTPFACVLRGGSTMVRVTKVDSLQPQPFTVLGWHVDDIHAVAAELAAAGVDLVRFEGMDQDDAGVWTTPGGDRVAWFRDPDGNTLSLTQFAPR